MMDQNLQVGTQTPPQPAVKSPAAANARPPANLDMLMDVPLKITVELGRTQMTLKQALDLVQGSVVELDRLAGDPVDVFINDRMIAKGEVVVVDDKFAVRITELVKNPEAEIK